MLARFSGSIGGGAVVAAALIYWMQLLIAGGEFTPAPAKPVVFLPQPRLPTPPPPRPRRTPPERPIERTAPPETTVIPTDPVPGPASQFVGVGPPAPPATAVAPPGRAGPWIADGDFVPMAQVRPIYPRSALAREIEGYVIIEFTITERGAVTDARIVESTDAVFERAALSAVQKFRYQPRIVGGHAVVAMGVRAQIAFELEN